MPQTVIESEKQGKWNCRRLLCGDDLLEILPDRGAMVSRWRATGSAGPVEILWTRDGFLGDAPGERHPLPGGIPILFPCCGPTERDGVEGRYLVDGAPHVMDKHGFAAWTPWREIDGRAVDGAVSIAFELTDDERTRASFPFAFRTVIRYTLEPSRLRIDWTIENRSEAPMPVNPGLHPYYRAPLVPGGRKADVELEAGASRRFLLKRPENIWTGESDEFSPGVLRVGDIPESPCMVGDLAEPRYRLRDPAGPVTLEATWPAPAGPTDGPYLNLFDPGDDVPAYCVEPFLGLQNALNHGRGLITIPPATPWKWRFALSVTV